MSTSFPQRRDYRVPVLPGRDVKPVLQLSHGDAATKNQNLAEHPGLRDSGIPVPQDGRWALHSSHEDLRLYDHFPFPGVTIHYILQCH